MQLVLPLLPASQRALAGLHVARVQAPVASLALPLATGRSALAIAGSYVYAQVKAAEALASKPKDGGSPKEEAGGAKVDNGLLPMLKLVGRVASLVRGRAS